MGRNNLKHGDLLYLPQDITIVRPDPEYGYPATVLKIKKPTTAVFIGETTENEYSILFKGEKWHAIRNQVYPMSENNAY